MNRTGKTTASKGIDKTYNEYKEFHEREVEAHICAAFMQALGFHGNDRFRYRVVTVWLK